MEIEDRPPLPRTGGKRENMQLRPYACRDLQYLTQLFYDTVHTVCAKDYTAAQLDAWAGKDMDQAAWDRSFTTHFTLVAEEGGMLLGFADLNGEYLDRLYVHHACLRRGVATALVDALESHARLCKRTCITTHASITARPFFEQRGFRVVREQTVLRGGVELNNFLMEHTLES